MAYDHLKDEVISVQPSRKATTKMLITIIKGSDNPQAVKWAEEELIRLTPEDW